MAFSCGFYNAIDHDRTYSATQFGEMFDGLITDGVYSTIGECFMVVPGSGLGVMVKSGRAWFNKTWSVNTADLPLDLGMADLLLPRIDMVILEVDTRVAVRNNSIKVVTGTPAVTPQRPGLTSGDGLYQYPLAYIAVAANASQITKSDITVVVGQTPCPFVTGILQSVPIDDMYQQWEGQFEEWFADVKSQLSGDVAGNLLHRIELVENRVDVGFYQNGDWIIKRNGNLVEFNYSKTVFVGLDKSSAVSIRNLRVEKIGYPFVLSKILFYETVYGRTLINTDRILSAGIGEISYFYRNNPFTCLTRTCELGIRTSWGARDTDDNPITVYKHSEASDGIPVSIKIVGLV